MVGGFCLNEYATGSTGIECHTLEVWSERASGLPSYPPLLQVFPSCVAQMARASIIGVLDRPPRCCVRPNNQPLDPSCLGDTLFHVCARWVINFTSDSLPDLSIRMEKLSPHMPGQSLVKEKEGDVAECRCSLGNLARPFVVRSRILFHQSSISPSRPLGMLGLPLFDWICDAERRRRHSDAERVGHEVSGRRKQQAGLSTQ